MLPLWYITSSSSADLEFNGAVFSKRFHYTAEGFPLIPACCIGVSRLATENHLKMISRPVFYRLWNTLLVGVQPWPNKHIIIRSESVSISIQVISGSQYSLLAKAKEQQTAKTWTVEKRKGKRHSFSMFLLLLFEFNDTLFNLSVIFLLCIH